MNWRTLVPGALVALAVLLGVVLVGPSSHAGQAVILMPEEDRDVPKGSQIPERRIEETEEKVREYKEKMKQKSSVQQQQRLPQSEQKEVPKP